MRQSSYDKRPCVPIGPDREACVVGWGAIVSRLAGSGVTCLECYPGAPVDDVLAAWAAHAPDIPTLDTRALFAPPAAIEAALRPSLTDDPVFGRLDPIGIEVFFDAAAVERARASLPATVAIIGPGAARVARRWDRVALVSMARWELQGRQRRGEIGNLGADNRDALPAEKYKRAFFVDWRVGDRIKTALQPVCEAVIDANGAEPRMIDGQTYRAALAAVARRPFRVVPFFDPGVWGGQWMRRHFDLPDGPPNYAWCFDCVPEENSLLLGFGDRAIELPALDLVLAEPRALLGEAVFARFGAEFPIRFDMLDTMEGGNLSLQVHPRAAYAREVFGLTYTQDESYYMLDAAPDAIVYLGFRPEIDPGEVRAHLEAAQAGQAPFPAERFVATWPARRHNHFLIPAGTVHCSGRNGMVLEISATPYIFTFKLWDWGRVGLDGRPRPIHLDHGLANLCWERRSDFTRAELMNRVTTLAETSDYRIERTGLHSLEFIETERAWFTGPVPFDTVAGVNVLNLVEGECAVVESPTGAFPPLPIHYAETFIVPAAAGAYRVRPVGRVDAPMGVIRAFVRPSDLPEAPG